MEEVASSALKTRQSVLRCHVPIFGTVFNAHATCAVMVVKVGAFPKTLDKFTVPCAVRILVK
jgi:hypothetical protein